MYFEPCTCPVCIHGPPERLGLQYRKTGVADDPVPEHAKKINYTHLAQTVAGTSVRVPCRMGVEDGLREEVYGDDSVKQGYKLMSLVECKVPDDVAMNPTGEFYAVWRVRYDACEPRNCTTQPEYDKKTGVYCPTNASGSFFLEHGDKCAIQCKSGYSPTTRNFVCDRGVFSKTPQCMKQTCRIPPPIEFGVGWSFPNGREVGELASPQCMPGYEPFRKLKCTPPNTAACYECLPEFVGTTRCSPMQCEPPPVIQNGYTDGCEGQKYGDLCFVGCDPGYFINGTTDVTTISPCSGTVGTDPTRRVLDANGKSTNLAQYENVPICVALTCDAPVVPFGYIASCPNLWKNKCEVMCERGYSSDGLWTRSGQPIEYICEDVNRTGVFETDWGPCAELTCPMTPSELIENIGSIFAIGNSSSTCALNERMLPGDMCGLTCKAGYELSAEITYLGCRSGAYVGYTADNMTVSKTLPAPTCKPYGSNAQTEDVVEAQVRLILSSNEEVQALATEDAREALARGMAKGLDVGDGSPLPEVTITHVLDGASTGRRLLPVVLGKDSLRGRRLDTTTATTTSTGTTVPPDPPDPSVIILFYVEAETENTLKFVLSTLEDWSTDPTLVPASVLVDVNTALKDTGIDAIVTGVSFTAPVLGIKDVLVTKREVEEEIPVNLIFFWYILAFVVAFGCLALCKCFRKFRNRLPCWRHERKGAYLTASGKKIFMTEAEQKEMMVQHGFRPPVKTAVDATQTEWATQTTAWAPAGRGSGAGQAMRTSPSVGPA
jgi:hypothetical protein